jgi:hypothetical protein
MAFPVGWVLFLFAMEIVFQGKSPEFDGSAIGDSFSMSFGASVWSFDVVG